MNNHKPLAPLAGVALASALTGCTELTHLGVSGEVSPIRSESVARHYSTLSLPKDAWLLPNTEVGDVDGDGIDDILISTFDPEVQPPPGGIADMTAYLFYGRAVIPEQLSYADADATFDSGILESMALGDVNGDGFSDFALGDGTGYEIVFGSPQRFSGHHTKFTTGHRLNYGGPAPEGGQQPVRFYRVLPAGDVNGDGADDFIIQATVPADNRIKVAFQEYLIEGRTGAWPSGPWDWSSAAAVFGADRPSEQAPVYSGSGDLDGDGYTDIMARGNDDRHLLYYGGPRGLQGTLTPAVADAVFDVGESSPWMVGDIDGDGADDLQIYSSGETQVVYGSSTRYAGTVTPQADLIFTGQSCSVRVGDFNGDGLNDMLVSAMPASEGLSPDEPPPPSELYELRGTGERLTGRKQLQPAEIYRPVGYAAPPGLARTGLSPFGDIDGDGSTDLASFAYTDPENNQEGAIYLLPGSTPSPQ